MSEGVGTTDILEEAKKDDEWQEKRIQRLLDSINSENDE
jgi:hypothetical protein